MITIYDIMQLIYWSYWGGMLVLLAIIIFAICKLIPAGGYRFIAIFCACIATPTFFILPLFEEDEEAKGAQTAYETRYAKARTIFDERCKTAGEKIYHTAENVEGITLLNLIPESSYLDYFDPMWEAAALEKGPSGMKYLEEYLQWEVKKKIRTNGGIYPTMTNVPASTQRKSAIGALTLILPQMKKSFPAIAMWM